MSTPSPPPGTAAGATRVPGPRVTIASGTGSGTGTGSGSGSGTASKDSSAPRRPTASTPFHPSPDTGTYRDLLLFEERLKMNAYMLRRRRRRYRVFLYSFIVAFILMAYRLVVLPPENIVLLRGLQALTIVVFITLALFFASGMYEEKIRYAHAYINHSNKALRPLNMYFNVRRPPTTFLSFLPLPAALRPSPAPMKAVSAPGKRSPQGRRVSHSQSHPGHTVMAQIPPSTNPRGELIFSSRVDAHFEEGYKRYRTAFERRREELNREKEAAAGPWYVRLFRGPREASPSNVTSRRGSHSAASPPGSRRGTPEPNAGAGSSSAAYSSSVRASSPARRRPRTPPPPSMERENQSRERAESYSFVYTGQSEAVGARASRS